uniref:Unannotated protein n=1 Tax=freshwater metagenome TaxID=449393 RepID=A0A6J7P136_9ZZZZ
MAGRLRTWLDAVHLVQDGFYVLVTVGRHHEQLTLPVVRDTELHEPFDEFHTPRRVPSIERELGVAAGGFANRPGARGLGVLLGEHLALLSLHQIELVLDSLEHAVRRFLVDLGDDQVSAVPQVGQTGLGERDCGLGLGVDRPRRQVVHDLLILVEEPNVDVLTGFHECNTAVVAGLLEVEILRTTQRTHAD